MDNITNSENNYNHHGNRRSDIIPFTYNVGFLDVFYNGVKLADTEFTASNGTAVVLNDVAYAGDVVELISYATAASGGGGGGASNLNDLADVTITGSPVIGETLT